MISQRQIRELINYNKVTGTATWKPRDISWFLHCKYPGGTCDSWNTRFANTEIKAIHKKENTNYIKTIITIGGKRMYFRLHRLIWLYVTGDFPDLVDHHDGNGINNKWENLKSVNPFGNGKNIKMCSRNTSGFTGVSWYEDQGKWRVKIKADGKYINGGSFINIDDAIKKRKQLNIKYGFNENHGRKK